MSEQTRITYLGSDCVRSGREKLGNAGGFETSLGESEGSAESSATGSNDDGVVLVIDDGVVADTGLTLHN